MADTYRVEMTFYETRTFVAMVEAQSTDEALLRAYISLVRAGTIPLLAINSMTDAASKRVKGEPMNSRPPIITELLK